MHLTTLPIAVSRKNWALYILLVIACVHPKFASAATSKPNVLIIYADDLGWAETGAQGCKDIPTPNIDSIAKNGVRCTQGYVAATYCSPSRAGLMTGRYPTRFGHEFNSIARHAGLSLQETTLANRLKTLGYASICIGKWHLGGDVSQDYYPTKRGFDEFFGTVNNTPFFHPLKFIDSRKSLDIQPISDASFYTTDEYGDRAVDWLSQQKGNPWFVYLPFNAQHAPLEAPKKYLDRFPNIQDEKRKIFAAMMSSMDDAVGRVFAKIREMGQFDNTIVYFVGDNGGPTASTTSNNLPLRGFKMTTFEGGPRVPFFVQWKDQLPSDIVYDYPVQNLDILPTCIAAAGGTVQPDWKLDGVNLTPYLKGENKARPHTTLYWRYGEQWAVRHEDMKLVVSKGGSGKPELYNIAKDIGESTDLAAAEPSTVAKLQKLYHAWSAEQAAPSFPENEQGQPKAGKKNKKKAAAK
ncbi:MAG: sulfatase-like hydrolase/transferase [Pirellulaceae bacterium]|nr:sulfatase-like hydrolase/transferase [Pirellulaceae bacterium]